MATFFALLLDYGLDVIAIGLSGFALYRVWRLRRELQTGMIEVDDPKLLLANLTPRFEFYPVEERTHAIRGRRLMNRTVLHFRNAGSALWYDDIVFEEPNKRVDVEILAENEVEFFRTPRDAQKIEPGESLRVAFERDLTAPTSFHFRLQYQDKNGELYFQDITGQRGEVPRVSAPLPQDTEA